MKKFLRYVISVSAPVVLLIFAVNYYVHPDYVYKCDIMDIVVSKAKYRLNTTNIDTNLDERLFKKKYLELYHDKDIDYLILGSSRFMTVSSEAVKGKTVLNLAISGARLEDLIAIYQASLDNKIHAKNVIVGVDPLFFNPNYGGRWWKTIAEYYYEFTNTSYDGGYNKLCNRIFSIDYFRLAILAIEERKKEKNKIIFTRDYKNEGFTRRFDGSVYYPRSFCERKVEIVDDFAKTKNDEEYNFEPLSSLTTNLFESLIDCIQSHNSTIIFVCCPYHPMFYHRIEKYKCILDSYFYTKELATRKNIMIIGNYNPEVAGFRNKDFYDEVHPKKESLDEIINKHL